MGPQFCEAREEPSVQIAHIKEGTQFSWVCLGFRSIDGSLIPFIDLQLIATDSATKPGHGGIKKSVPGQLHCHFRRLQ